MNTEELIDKLHCKVQSYLGKFGKYPDGLSIHPIALQNLNTHCKLQLKFNYTPSNGVSKFEGVRLFVYVDIGVDEVLYCDSEGNLI